MSGRFRNGELHPYGVVPLGNLYVTKDQDLLRRRRVGLGVALQAVPDEALIELLSFLSAEELAKVSRASRAFYVYAHHSDLWRDLTLRRFEGTGVSYRDSWKETFVATLYRNEPNRGGPHVKHVPIKVTGIFSNLLHRAWSCHSCDLDSACPGFYSFDDVPREDATKLSKAQFIKNYEMKNLPVVIRNAVQDWSALQKWTPEYLTRIGGQCCKFRATSATAPVAAVFTLEEYFNYAQQAREEAPLYLFDRDFGQHVPSLLSDFSVPSYFDPFVPSDQAQESEPEMPAEYRTDLFRVFGERERPDYRWLICGPARSGSIFHIDPNATNAWNCSVQGKKKWIFYPPGVAPPGVLADSTGAEVTVPISTGEWLLSFWKAHLECRRDPDPRRRPIETIALPGEVVFVPHGYWHMVVNLDHCIAITQNYVSSANLADCLRFLRETPDQISGVRDRQDAIQPEDFFDTFVKQLGQELSPHVLEGIIEESKVATTKTHKQAGFDWMSKKRRRKPKDVQACTDSSDAAQKKESFSFDFAF